MNRKRLINADTINTFSARLKRARREAGIQQRDMADRLGMNYLTYAAIERGVSQATISHLAALSDHLGISADYLIGLSDDPKGAEGAIASEADALAELAKLRNSLKLIGGLAAGAA